MNKFKILKYWGYGILFIPTVITVFIVYGTIQYITTPDLPFANQEKKNTDTVIVVNQPIQITNPIVEKTTNNNTTIITKEAVPVVEQVKPEPVKQTSVVKPQPIDTTKIKDSL